MSKFDYAIFYGGYDSLAVSKEKYTKEEAIEIAKVELEYPKRKEGKYGKTKISKERADWCPLRKLPEKKPEEVPVAYSHFGAYNDGWNACIDEITGEQEG